MEEVLKEEPMVAAVSTEELQYMVEPQSTKEARLPWLDKRLPPTILRAHGATETNSKKTTKQLPSSRMRISTTLANTQAQLLELALYVKMAG